MPLSFACATLLGCPLDEAGAPDVYKSPAQLQLDFAVELMPGSARADKALLEEAATSGIIIEGGGKVKNNDVQCPKPRNCSSGGGHCRAQ